MPELPEVETMVRDLRPRVVGRTITDVEASYPGEVVYPGFNDFVQRVTGQTITEVSRRGKYALLPLGSGDLLIVHRGMSGSLLLRPREASLEQWVRLTLRLDDGTELRFQDPRKFGRILVMDAQGHERPFPWDRMGPEPLNGDFSPAVLRQSLAGRKGLIKPLLLNQHIVAGLGNIYVDEALFRARIHPERRAHTLTPAETRRLYGAIREVLAEAIERRGTTFNNYTDIEGRRGNFQQSLQVFRQAGTPCVRCGKPIVKSVVGGRGTHFCPRCQRI